MWNSNFSEFEALAFLLEFFMIWGLLHSNSITKSIILEVQKYHLQILWHRKPCRIGIEIRVSNSIKSLSIPKTLLPYHWIWGLRNSSTMKNLWRNLIQFRIVVFGSCNHTQPPIWIWIRAWRNNYFFKLLWVKEICYVYE